VGRGDGVDGVELLKDLQARVSKSMFIKRLYGEVS